MLRITLTVDGDENSGYRHSWQVEFGGKEPSELELKLLSVFAAPKIEAVARVVLEQKKKATANLTTSYLCRTPVLPLGNKTV